MSAFALDDLRVLELTDHRGEFLGRLLAGFGADVIKVEPQAGSDSRTLGPFYQDSGDPEQRPVLLALQLRQARGHA